MIKVKVRFSAYSNISYRPTITVEFDDEDWFDMSVQERCDLIDEKAREWLANDVEWDYMLPDVEPEIAPNAGSAS